MCVLCGSSVWSSPPVVGPLLGPPLCVGPLCGSPVRVPCVGPLCGPPLRWLVLCGALPSVWVPCVGPLCGSPLCGSLCGSPVWVPRRAAACGIYSRDVSRSFTRSRLQLSDSAAICMPRVHPNTVEDEGLLDICVCVCVYLHTLTIIYMTTIPCVTANRKRDRPL